jgi:putative transposase
VHADKRGLNGKPGPPVHDDLVDRRFVAKRLNETWLTDITEQRTDEGKLYLCAIKDVHSNKIVGYSIGSRMKAALAVGALRNAIALREPAGTIVHSDSENELAGVLGVPDPHSDGHDRMLVPDAPRVS